MSEDSNEKKESINIEFSFKMDINLGSIYLKPLKNIGGYFDYPADWDEFKKHIDNFLIEMKTKLNEEIVK